MEDKAIKDLHPIYREEAREGDASDPDRDYAAAELRAEWHKEMDELSERGLL